MYEFYMGEKKTFSARMDDELLRRLKHLAVDEDETLGTLLEQAVADLLKKYDRRSKPGPQAPSG